MAGWNHSSASDQTAGGLRAWRAFNAGRNTTGEGNDRGNIIIDDVCGRGYDNRVWRRRRSPYGAGTT